MQRLILASLITTSAMAASGVHAATTVEQARVRNVQPQYETVQVPREACTSQWVNETRRVEAPRQYGGAVIGGVAGAVLGNQVGDGSGRQVATALGAVLGAFTGDRLANRSRNDHYETVPREVRNCQTVQEMQQRITGYQVTYEYRGQEYTTVMAEAPGRTVPIQVSVNPMDGRGPAGHPWQQQHPWRQASPYGQPSVHPQPYPWGPTGTYDPYTTNDR